VPAAYSGTATLYKPRVITSIGATIIISLGHSIGNSQEYAEDSNGSFHDEG